MNITELYYPQLVTQHSKMLINMKSCLQKANTFIQTKKCEEGALLSDRLAPDMFNLTRQIQISTDLVKLGAARLSGKTAPSFEDTETTLEQLLTRIDKTLAFLSTLSADDFKDGDSKIATFSWLPGKGLKGRDYFTGFVIPNVHFHIAAVYMILRTNGVELEKADFVGDLPFIEA